MIPAVHVDAMHRALDGLFSTRALGAMIRANVGVDAFWNQLGRHELHFDNNAFEASRAFVDGQRALIEPSLRAGNAINAWRAFGRLTHTAQDFYAHSNYVDLWMACQPNGAVPRPYEIDPLDDSLVASPALRSGKAYLPLGLASFLPIVGKWLEPLMPRDSHARMNLDSASRGPLFEYAFHAAVKRTRIEYDHVVAMLPAALIPRFRDLAG